ncbi:MAG TPA: alpha/beta hydrolase [Candidatus Lokiarchaeia archaeon]|nr:alpha/beta hydrolase [Candidatus Lokiarchaeia archaeon]
MDSSTFTFTDADGVEIFVYKWLPDDGNPKAVVQICHGLAEYGGRYGPIAEFLTAAGYACYADDHRGHGKTAGSVEKLGIMGPRGWEGTMDEVHQLTSIIKEEFPNLPIFFLGHSWGSLLGQDYIQQFGNEVKGAILSGTNGKQSFLVRKLGPIIAKRNVKKLGPNTPSQFAFDQTWGKYNKRFEPAPTKFEWINSDHAKVEEYLSDQYCGWTPLAGLAAELVYGTNKIAKKTNEVKIPKTLPIFIITGAQDTSNDLAKGAEILYKRYKSYSIKDVTYKAYPGDRHEILQETNQAEVIQDVLNWLDAHL